MALPQVLVVGSGPAGLVLALSLAQNGIPLRIIEKRSEFHQSQRGAGVQPRSIELYKFLGLYDEIKASSIPVLPIHNYKLPGGREVESVVTLLPPIEETPGVPYPNPLMIGQDHAESIIRSHLDKFGIEVERSTELVSFQQDHDGVTAEILKRSNDDKETKETTRFDFLVGADGARGVTRKQLGLTFLGESTSTHSLIGDVFVKGLTTDAFHSWRPSDTKEMLVFRPMEIAGLFYIILSATDPADYPKISASKENLQEFVNTLTNRDDITIESIRTLAEFRPSVRMVNKFGEGRAFVVGDAAHVHSPAGGQGMNSSIQDSFNLAWKLSLVCKNVSPLSILDTYSDERLPIIQEMLAKTVEVHKKILEGVENKNTQAAWDRPKSLNQLRVNCRWSSILVDEQVEDHEGAKVVARNAYGSETDDQVRAGDRAPDASGLVNIKSNEKISLFSILKPTYHTALLFNPPTTELPVLLDTFATWPSGTVRVIVVLPKGGSLATALPKDAAVLEDREGHAHQTYKQMVDGGFPVVIIRPDGVVGAIAKGAAGVNTYQKKLFTV